jgi:hypothetical protein
MIDISPEKPIERSMIRYDPLICESIFPYTESFESISDHREVLNPSEEFFIRLRDQCPDIEVPETFSIFLPLIQYEFPGDACLCSLETEKLEESMIIMDRHSPLFIVVGDIERILGICPVTATIAFHEMSISCSPFL